MQDVLEGLRLPDNWSGTQPPGGPGEPRIELTLVPPIGSFTDLKGQIWHVPPIGHKVAIYIYVGGGWWSKPTFANPLTSIRPDGSWIADITTGGSDEQATMIAAYLVPNGYNPPLASGLTILSPELEDNAAAKVVVTRTSSLEL
jgi:hypothetical protein